jgi:DNA-3-methyladenine glycosylase
MRAVDVSGRLRALERGALAGSALEASRALLGALLWREDARGPIVTRIVEVEAYDQDDPASHSMRGPTARNRAMFGPAGHAYVYRSYGIHWCMNVSAGPPGRGAAVLVRAGALLSDPAPVAARRTAARGSDVLLTGPGCLSAGLDIDGPRHDGIDLCADGPVRLLRDRNWPVPEGRIARGPRVGVSQAADVEWRLWIAGSPQVSRYRRSPRAD